MTATTDQISQYPSRLSMRHRRLLLRNRAGKTNYHRPEHEPFYFLLGLFVVAAFGFISIERCHHQNMITMSDCDLRVERCR